MRRLQGQDEQFMSERQRQAELARLKREKLKAKQEDKFSAAALVLGLAEKQKAAVEERWVFDEVIVIIVIIIGIQLYSWMNLIRFKLV